MSFGGPNTQSILVKPPIKGSFPLDHDGTCTDSVVSYLNCVKRASKLLREGEGVRVTEQDVCRELIKEYFECRMRHGLMEREEWRQLGLDEGGVGDGDGKVK